MTRLSAAAGKGAAGFIQHLLSTLIMAVCVFTAAPLLGDVKPLLVLIASSTQNRLEDAMCVYMHFRNQVIPHICQLSDS